MRQRHSHIADIASLAQRYEIPGPELDRLLDDDGRLIAQEFGDVRIWYVAETDAWFCRWLRTQSGVQQGDLAEVLGVTQAAVSAWELGKSVMPSHIAPSLRQILQQIKASQAA